MSQTSPLASPQRHLCELKVAKSCKICIESAFAQPTSTNHICLVGGMYHRIQTLPCTVIKHSRHIKTRYATVLTQSWSSNWSIPQRLESTDSEVEICNGGSWFVKKVNLHKPKMFPTEGHWLTIQEISRMINDSSSGNASNVQCIQRSIFPTARSSAVSWYSRTWHLWMNPDEFNRIHVTHLTHLTLQFRFYRHLSAIPVSSSLSWSVFPFTPVLVRYKWNALGAQSFTSQGLS